VLVALLLSGVALVGVELGRGRSTSRRRRSPIPASRGKADGGIDATIQRIVLDGLDGAACRLHTTREELAALARRLRVGRHRRWDAHTIEVALRAGLLRSVDAAVQRGDVPEFLRRHCAGSSSARRSASSCAAASA
jgi:hypothetical protein